MNVGFLKVDFHDYNIKDMEDVYLSTDLISLLYCHVQDSSVVSDCVCLMTCNRVEIYFMASDFDLGVLFFQEFYLKQKGVSKKRFSELMTFFSSELDVIQHLFGVVSGIQSMVFGEDEILSQVKTAYDAARSHLVFSSYFNKLFQIAIATGKRVRSETAIGVGSASISSIAVEAVRNHIFDYFEKRILIIGAGVMGKRCLRKFHCLGHPNLFVSNRTASNLLSLQSKYDFDIISFEKLKETVSGFDVVICAMRTSLPMLAFSDFLSAEQKSRLLIDLGVPRNISEDVDQIDDLNRLTISGLQSVAEKNIGHRKKQLQAAQFIIEDQCQLFLNWKNRCVQYHS